MRVHHIEFVCRDLKHEVEKFHSSYGFKIYGKWRDQLFKAKEKVVLKRNSVYFVLHEDKEAPCEHVSNIALETEGVEETCMLLPIQNVLQKPVIISDDGILNFQDLRHRNMNCKRNYVKGALVHSPIGNMKHTLIDKSNYRGDFLPNFTLAGSVELATTLQEKTKGIECEIKGLTKSKRNGLMLDHITIAVYSGTSFHLMKWYADYMKMFRTKLNNDEKEDGFKIETINDHGDKLGLQLTAMQYHFCSEQTMQMISESDFSCENPKLVFAESLLGQGPNQVDTFLKENDGPGVQHIGLLSADIFESVELWLENDVKFISPPRQYYDEIGKRINQINSKSFRSLLQKRGVLLDVEETDPETGVSKYLLQVFTKPIFSKETFFFELIQRNGATGFGAGNISALWRAVDAYLRENNKLIE